MSPEVLFRNMDASHRMYGLIVADGRRIQNFTAPRVY
jgi:hypothetical protein